MVAKHGVEVLIFDVTPDTIGHMSEITPWTDEEIGLLIDRDDLTAEELGFMLGRSTTAVSAKRYKVRQGWERALEPWTEDEDAFILATPHMTAAQVSDRLPGRSRSAVDGRRSILAAVKHVTFGVANKSPFMVGRRPLIAKTCSGCGLLLQAQWFNKRTKGGHVNKCYRCNPNKKGRKPQYDDPTKAKRRADKHRLQAATLPHAINAGAPWREADHAVLSDPDLTLTEKALSLGRTYNSVSTICSREGYVSKLGLGDPERDQWMIDNPNAKEYAL